MTEHLESKQSIRFGDKVFICLAIFLTNLVVVSGANWIARTDYFFSHPSKMDNLRSLPAISSTFFQYYHYGWAIVGVVFGWSAYLAFRKRTTGSQIAVLSAYTALMTATYAAIAAMALYACNQTLVFKFQHLR